MLFTATQASPVGINFQLNLSLWKGDAFPLPGILKETFLRLSFIQETMVLMVSVEQQAAAQVLLQPCASAGVSTPC